VRNLFDQYKSPENRLTHALASCLDRDRRLLRSFVRWASGRKASDARGLKVVEQQIPGEPMPRAEDEAKSLPDLWIHGDDEWSLVVESKVDAAISPDQLRRHRRMAERNGFTDIDLVAIAPTAPKSRIDGVIHKTWPEIYSWARKHMRDSSWAACLADYMEVAEAQMIADEYLGDGTITRFDGIPFNSEHPYTYREGKRVLQLAMDELRQRRDLRKLGMDPDGEGRPAITGKDGTSVWDFLPLKAARGNANFTECPHLTLAIGAQRTVVIVTLPNAVSSKMRRNVTSLGLEGFTRLINEVNTGVEKVVRRIDRAYPFMEASQQHFPSQRSASINDARLEFDLRTAVGSRASAIRKQPQWLAASFDALANKRSNLQVAIGSVLKYGDKRLRSREILDVIAGVWIGCKPWIRTILGS